MKKLLFLVLMAFILSGCGSKKAESEYSVRDTISVKEDSAIFQINEPLNDTINDTVMDTVKPKMLDTVSRKEMEISPLDTTSVIPQMKRNLEKIHHQQKALDSLILMKKQKRR